jgi:hypothetical protein
MSSFSKSIWAERLYDWYSICVLTQQYKGNPETLEMSLGWNDMYDGFSLLVGHGLFCITRIERDW